MINTSLYSDYSELVEEDEEYTDRTDIAYNKQEDGIKRMTRCAVDAQFFGNSTSRQHPADIEAG